MKCIHPIQIKNPGYYAALKEGDFDRAHTLPQRIEVPCGKCYYCQSKRRSEWTFRLWVETMNSSSSFFVTLTYDNEHFPTDGKLSKRDFQLFMKRVRKKYGPGIRFFGCGEYGPTTHRPHYHLILFNLPLSRNSEKDLTLSLQKLWTLGFTSLSPANINRIGYLSKYILKSDYNTEYKPFMLCSTRPAIGYQFNVNYDEVYENSGKVSYKGHRSLMPRYYRNFLSREQRKQLQQKVKSETPINTEIISLNERLMNFQTQQMISDRKLKLFSKKSKL